MSPSYVVVKARLGEDVRKFKLNLVYDLQVDFMALRSIIQEKFQLGSTDDYMIKYKDEGDLITVANVEDFKECVNHSINEAATLYLVVQRKNVPLTTSRLSSFSIMSTQSSISESPANSSKTRESISEGANEQSSNTNNDGEGDAIIQGLVDVSTMRIEDDEVPVCEAEQDVPSVAVGTDTASSGNDVTKALNFVRMVHERFQGDERAQEFLRIGAAFHDKKINRDDFHAACLGLFADDDELLDSFLVAFNEVGEKEEPTESNPVEIIQQERDQVVKSPLEEQDTPTADANQGSSPVSSVAFMVNELQYARLLVQTRLQSLFWQTRKRVQHDTEPAMTELKEFVRNDIIKAARQETRRLVDEARRASDEIPPANEVVDAVIEGLEEASRVTKEVTAEIVKTVSGVVNEVMATDDESPRSSVEMQPVPTDIGESYADVHVTTASQSDVAGNHQADGVSEEPAPPSSFSLRGEATEGSAEVEGSIENEKKAETRVDDFVQEVEDEEETSTEGEQDAENSTSDSFVMISKDSDADSMVSLVMPVPDVSGDIVEDGPVTADDRCKTKETETAPDPTEEEEDEHEEDIPTVAATNPSYHKRAAAVSSSKVIDNLFVLYDMGFTDFDENLGVLTMYANNLMKSVVHLCDLQERGK